MAMLRHRRRVMPDLEMRLVKSVRTAEEVIYAGELGDDAALTFTRESPDGGRLHRAHRRRADREAAVEPGTGFVCGSNGFVETASRLLLETGFAAGGSDLSASGRRADYA